MEDDEFIRISNNEESKKCEILFKTISGFIESLDVDCNTVATVIAFLICRIFKECGSSKSNLLESMSRIYDEVGRDEHKK